MDFARKRLLGIEEIVKQVENHDQRLTNVERWVGVSNSDVIECYISPNGSDNELKYVRLNTSNINTYIGYTYYISETMYGSYTPKEITSNHIGYYLISTPGYDPTSTVYGDGSNGHPFKTINKASEYLSRHRASKPTVFRIKAAGGTYEYTTTQYIYHPDAVGIGGSFYIILEKMSPTSGTPVFVFKPAIATMTMQNPFVTCEKCAVYLEGVEFEFMETSHSNWIHSVGVYATDNSRLVIKDSNFYNFSTGIQVNNGTTIRFLGSVHIQIDEDFPVTTSGRTEHVGETNTLLTNDYSFFGLLIQAGSTFDITLSPLDKVNVFISNYQTGIRFESNSITNAYYYFGSNEEHGEYNLYISSFSQYALEVGSSSKLIGFLPSFYPFYKFGSTHGDFSNLIADTTRTVNDEFGFSYTATQWNDILSRYHPIHHIYPIRNTSLGYDGVNGKFTNLAKILGYDLNELAVIG